MDKQKILIALLVFTAAVVRADTWKVNAETFGVSVPASTQYTVFWQIVGDLDPNNASGPVNVLSSGTSSQGTTGGVPAVISYNSGIRTQTVPFHLEVGWRDSAGVFHKTGWRMAYNSTTNPSGNGNGGGYNPNGEPTSLSGQPVDTNGNPVQASSNTAIVDVGPNTTGATKEYRITTRDLGGNIISQQIVSQLPGANLRLKLGENQPFTWQLDEVTSGGDGGPMTFTPSQSGSSYGSSTSSGTGTNAQNTPSTISTPAAVTNQTRPGTSPDPNAESRHTELRDELKRIVTNANTIGNAAHQDSIAIDKDIQAVRKALEDFKTQAHNDFTTQQTTATNTSSQAHTDAQAIKTAVESMNTGGGPSSNVTVNEPSGTVTQSPDTTGADGSTAGEGVRGDWQVLKDDIAQLTSKVSVALGTASLAWDFSLPLLGAVTVSLEGWSSQIAAFRSFLLIGVTFFSLWHASKILRGAWVDE